MNNCYSCYIGNSSSLPSNVLPDNANNQNNCTQNCQANNCTNDNLLDTLCNCIGRRCTCEFEINDRLESRSGVLERIGNDYLVLRALNNNRILYCNTCGLRFVTIM